MAAWKEARSHLSLPKTSQLASNFAAPARIYAVEHVQC